jgi:hypothetical protein
MISRFGHHRDRIYTAKANEKCLKEFDISKDSDCIILIKSGGLIIRKSMLSFRSLPKSIKVKIAAIITFPGTKINMVSCELRGNNDVITAGCIFINTDILMSSCKLYNLKGGGIFITAHRGNTIKIADSEISKSGVAGIYA